MKPILNFILILFSINLLFGEFNNVKILDFKSEKDLKKYMKSISKDLGVKCTYCHNLNDKSLETEHKIIAREMIKMQNSLNKDFFLNKEDSIKKQENITQISCWTCHRGSKTPDLIRPK